jgi:hypothetical protein
VSRDPYVVVNGERFTFAYDIEGAFWERPIPECPSCHEPMSVTGAVTGIIHDADTNPLAVICPECDARIEVTR